MTISAPAGAPFAPAAHLPEGTRVATRYRGAGKRLYEGRILSRNAANGTYDVGYTDGDKWLGCPERHLWVWGQGAWEWLVPEAPGRPRVALHRVEPGAWADRCSLDAIFRDVVTEFRPHVVRYSNTNPKIAAQDAATFDKSAADTDDHVHGTSEAPTQWKSSAYCDLSELMAGAMQKAVQPDARLRRVCEPLLKLCDERFTAFYESLHGAGAVKDLGRMQSFVTRYRPVRGESGLLRHVDGAQVDGSAILALPTTAPFEGGGVTVWERLNPDAKGDAQQEVEYFYPMDPGDMCCMDTCVWHQGNPIVAGERWSLVVFYRVAQKRPGSRVGAALKMAARDGILQSALAASKAAGNADRRE